MSAPDKPQVSIIVLNYNGQHLLEECLQSVSEQTYQSFEIIMVDNGSADGSVPFVRERFPQVRILALSTNRGFAGGNNEGVKIARGDLVVLLNNDTIVEADWLFHLVRAVDPQDVACASSLIITDGMPDIYYEKNGSINFLGHNIMRAFESKKDIFFAGGASLIFKKHILGLPFDEDYFAYSEDVHLSLRARFMGYRVVNEHASIVKHLGNETTRKQPSEFITFLQERNRILNLFIFFSGWTILRILPYIVLNIFAKSFEAIVAGRYSLKGLWKAYFWFLSHKPAVLTKRQALAETRRVREEIVIRAMSGKVSNSSSFIGKLANLISLAYLRAVGIRTIECVQPESSGHEDRL